MTETIIERAGPVGQRALAPDLARGFMLLVIATVHAHLFRVATGGSGFALAGPADYVTTTAMALFGENRGYPMFAALFGYGLAQIYRRRAADGIAWVPIRRFIRRRGWWLIAIGAVHTALLFYGDVISVYGTIALLFVAILRFSDRALVVNAVCWLVLGSALYAVVSGVFFDAAAGGAVTNPLIDAGLRLITMPVFVPLLISISVFPFLVGILAARRRLLEDPGHHLRLLRRVAVVGITVGVLGGVAQAMINIEVWQPTGTIGVAVSWLHLITGYAGGFGYAAGLGLIAHRVGSRPGPVITALAATGRRSMTSYVLQSVAWAVLIPPYALNLAPALTDTQAVLIGVGVWLATVIASEAQRRAGFRQGPLEWFLRRMSYGRRPATVGAEGPSAGS